MKIIALYLPQYHNIPENDIWWGKGYTEWTSVRRGKKLIEGQYQPREPLNDNYYDLLDIDNMKWQVEIAKNNGIYGFCFYHYWFNGHLLLEKPLENFLKHQEINFNYYLCWANETWTTVWEGDENPTILMSHDYGNKKDVDSHFYYLLNFFKDRRYMRIDDKPILNIYNPIAIPYSELSYMLNRWNELAIQEGFPGLYFTYLCAESMRYMTNKYKRLFQKGVEYEPSYVEFLEKDKKEGQKKYKIEHMSFFLKKHCPLAIKIKNILVHNNNKPIEDYIDGVKTIKNYDDEWKKILDIKHSDYQYYTPGAFVDWDNTSRRGKRGKVVIGASPEKFEKYFEQLVKRSKNLYHSDSIVVFAWNEWSEGGYLEPDKKWGFGYLNAIKTVLEKTGELEKWD